MGGFSVARATSVAGGLPGAIPEENPNSMMIRETQSQAQHAEFHLARERELEKQHQRLYDEFKLLDVNQDGCITLDEVLHFLQTKVTIINNI